MIRNVLSMHGSYSTESKPPIVAPDASDNARAVQLLPCDSTHSGSLTAAVQFGVQFAITSPAPPLGGVETLGR